MIFFGHFLRGLLNKNKKDPELQGLFREILILSN